MKRLATIILCAFLIFSSGFVYQDGLNDARADIVPETGTYVPHTPIKIDSNADFTFANGVTKGDGSQAEPWVIENYEIDGMGVGYGIYIGNTTEYVEIKNCSLHDADGTFSFPVVLDAGLNIYNAQNLKIINSTLMQNSYGVYS